MKKVINFDWLSFSYMIAWSDEELLHHKISLNEHPDYRFEFLDGTHVFNNRVIVRNLKGEKIATLLHSPKSSMLNPAIMLVEIANKCLYSNEFRKFVSDLHQFHQGSIHNLTRLDVCCDFDEIGDDIAKMFDLQKIYVQKKKNGSSFYSYVNIDDNLVRYPHQFSFGSKSSKLKWKLYNKTLELAESKKYYIRQCWYENGLSERKNIWRLEFSLTRCSSLILLHNDNNLLSVANIVNHNIADFLFAYFYSKHFVVRKNEGRYSNKKNPNSIYNFLNIICNEDAEFRLREIEPYATTENDIYITFKHLVIDFQRSVIKFNYSLAEEQLRLIFSMCNCYNMETYLYDKFGFDLSYLENLLANPNDVKEL